MELQQDKLTIEFKITSKKVSGLVYECISVSLGLFELTNS